MKKNKLEKVLLGFVLGSAILGVVGLTSKTTKGQKIINDSKKIIKKNTKTFWHFLNKLFIKK